MQKRLTQEVYQECKLSPSQISYVEAHGTGTVVGDPVEVSAIADVFCPGREEPLWIGSVKSNMGHAEAASGNVEVDMRLRRHEQHDTDNTRSCPSAREEESCEWWRLDCDVPPLGRPGSRYPRQTSRRKDRYIIRHAYVEPIVLLTADQTPVAPSLRVPVSSRTISRCLG
ncbi:fatty acid synthase [Trichonephila clavipes]|nr:fatty acid synthase [Trichonephila clavipes]